MLTLVVLLMTPPSWLRAAIPTLSAKPNIVFILFDDMGYGEPPGFRAGSEFKTPSLDQLARDGMRFTDAHTAASVCTPTRCGVLTGRYSCSRLAGHRPTVTRRCCHQTRSSHAVRN